MDEVETTVYTSMLVLAIVVYVLGLVSSLALSYVMLRFKRLRNPQNVLIATWLLADSLQMVPPIIDFEVNTKALESVNCSLQSSFDCMCAIAVLATVVDWIVLNYLPQHLDALRKKYVYTLLTIVVVPSTLFADNLFKIFVYGHSLNETYFLAEAFVLVSGALSMFAQCLAIISCFRELKDTYIVFTTAMFILPLSIKYTLYLFFKEYLEKMENLVMLLLLLQYCSLLRNVIILCKHKHAFGAIIKVLKCYNEEEMLISTDVTPKKFSNLSHVIICNRPKRLNGAQTS